MMPVTLVENRRIVGQRRDGRITSYPDKCLYADTPNPAYKSGERPICGWYKRGQPSTRLLDATLLESTRVSALTLVESEVAP